MAETLPLTRLHKAGALALSGLLLLVACGPGEPREPQGSPTEQASGDDPTSRRGGTVVAGTIADIDTVNEALSSGTRATDSVVFQMFLHLLDERPDFADHPPTYAPELAESYEWSEDHLELTFHLREDAVWSDGEPVTAEDVRFTWQAHTHPAVAYDQGYLKEDIRDVEVVDPHTVKFHYDRVAPWQLNAAIEGVILPEHAWGAIPFDEWRSSSGFFRDNLVVSGPFALERWTPQQEIVLGRNDRYFDPELPYLDRVVFRLIPEKSNQITQLLAGDLDVVEHVPIADIERVRKAPETRVDTYWHRLYSFVAWNIDRPMFADATVRRALTMAIDRRMIIETLWGEYARVAVSPIVHTVWAFNDELDPWPYDPERARELLADAGWTDSDGDGVLDRDGVPFRFELMTNQGNQERLDATVMIQDQLKRIGIRADPRVIEFNAMLSSLSQRDFDATFGAWGMPTTLELRYAFHSSEIDGGGNYSGYSNEECDRLIERMESMPDLAETEPILLRLQEIIHRDQPMTFMWESKRTNGLDRRLRGVRSNLLGTYWNLHEWWLAPERE